MTDNQMPDIIETSIESARMLRFLLPATALHIKSDLIMEISVDYGYADENRDVLVANAWAREVDTSIKGYISTVRVEAGPNEDERIFECLNSNEEFIALLTMYVEMVMRHSIED